MTVAVHTSKWMFPMWVSHKPEDLCITEVSTVKSGRNVVSFHFSAHMNCQTGECNRISTFVDRKGHFRHIMFKDFNIWCNMKLFWTLIFNAIINWSHYVQMTGILLIHIYIHKLTVFKSEFVKLSPEQNGRHFAVNSIPPLVQIMAWRQIDDKPLFETMLTQFTNACFCGGELIDCCGVTPHDVVELGDNINQCSHTVILRWKWNFNQNKKKCSQENTFQNVVCTVVAILSPMCWTYTPGHIHCSRHYIVEIGCH